ncbi:MAG: glycosyltransferase family 39 protein [Thermodesulfobacteriota bacterium]
MISRPPIARARGFGRFEKAFVTALVLTGALLLFTGLDNRFLWQDEAQTALIGRTVLTRGLPYGTDGINYFSQEEGAEYGPDHIWKWHPWLQFYLAALSFKIMGPTTLAARLPFALFGLGTIVLLYFFARRLWPDKRAAEVAAVLLLFCLWFLILARQARYYAPAAFFSLWGLHAYLGLAERRPWSMAGFIMAAALLFHTHYLYAGTLLATVLVHGFIYHRGEIKRLVLACLLICVICSPWIVWLATLKYQEAFGAEIIGFAAIFSRLLDFAKQVAAYVFPFYLAALPLIVEAVLRFRKKTSFFLEIGFWQDLSLPGLFVIFNLAALSLTSPLAFFRYLAPLIPPLLALAGLLIHQSWRLFPPLAVLLMITALILQPLKGYLFEITHRFPSPTRSLVEFLREKARPGDVVAITYGDLPLKFYTGLRIVGGLTGEDPALVKQAKWVIIRRKASGPLDLALRDYYLRRLDLKDYRTIILDSPDYPHENRESPDVHPFSLPQGHPPVMVLERK